MARKKETWMLIRSLYIAHNSPWLIGGDFNEVLRHEEKQGGNPRPEAQLRRFRDLLDSCHLQELGYTGSCITWCNNRESPWRTVTPEWQVSKPTWTTCLYLSPPQTLISSNVDVDCSDLRPCGPNMKSASRSSPVHGPWVNKGRDYWGS